MRIGVDSGGTFTDFVWADAAGLLHALKLPSTPGDPAAAVVEGVQGILSELSELMAGIEVIHGTTVATNALLTRQGARVMLLTTAGFEDVLEIGRQDRPELYALHPLVPEPLVPASLRFGVKERIAAGGEVIEELTSAELERVVTAVRSARPEAIAICLLHSYVNPMHEQRLAAAIREQLTDLSVVASYEVDPQPREFERTSTTVIHAYLVAGLSSYLRELEQRLSSGVELRLLTSSGGTATADQACARPADLVLSGPAGGAAAAAEVARRAEVRNFIGLDMGGTSTDVCLGWGGAVAEDTGREIAGFPLRVPRLAVHTIGAGGGSIAHAGLGGVLLVGPQSAGADPGPAAYGRGGPPTVTDANLVLGRLPADIRLGGHMILDPGRAREAIIALARQLDLDVDACAMGIVAIADQKMAQAAAAVSQQRGYDPRACTLIPFGGAGALHACGIADQLGITSILVPPNSGVLSALGALTTAPRHDAGAAVLRDLAEWPQQERDALWDRLKQGLAREIPAPRRFKAALQCRYRGQGFELAVACRQGDSSAALAARFHHEHQRTYGYRRDDYPVEVVAMQLTVSGRASGPGTVVWADNDLVANTLVTGPAVILETTATIYVAAGWIGCRDSLGNLILTQAGDGPAA